MVVALGLLAVPSHAGADVEVGSYLGGGSTSVFTTYSCPTSTTGEVCGTSSEPHEGAKGITLGAFGRYAVIPAVMIEANVLYAQKGYDVEPTVRVDYLEAPLLVRVDPLRGRSPARLFAFAGVAPAVRVGCSASGVAFDNAMHTSYAYSGSCDSAPTPPTPSRFDLGGVLGGGVGWTFGFGTLELQARFARSLIDIGGRGGGGTTVNDAFYVLAGFGRTLGTP